MFRSALFFVVAACLVTVEAFAEQPRQHLVVAANRQVASAIGPLLTDARLVVLFEDDAETYDMINTRALRLCSASSFIHAESVAHELTPIFIERFRNHGVRIVILPMRRRVTGLDRQTFDHPTPATFANLQEVP